MTSKGPSKFEDQALVTQGTKRKPLLWEDTDVVNISKIMYC